MGSLEKEDAALIESKSGSLLTLEEGADASFSPVDVDDFARFHYEEEETNFPSHHTTNFEHHHLDDEIYDENCSPDSPHDLSWKEYIAKTARNMIVGVCASRPTCFSKF